MKFLHLTVRFEYADAVGRILDRHPVDHYVRIRRTEGRDRDGKHFGTQVFPGSVSVLQAQVPEDVLDELLEDLRAFRDESEAHAHLEAVVLPVERRLVREEDDATDTG